MKNIISILLLALLIFLPSATAEEIDLIPKKTGAATALVSLNWAIALNGQQVNSITVKTFGFQDYPSQIVTNEKTTPQSSINMDKYLNEIREFELDSSKDYQTFSLESEVEVNFGFEFPAAPDASNYLDESEYVRITPEIREKALQISAKYNGEIEKAVAIAEWVHNNVRYDRNYITVSKGSDSVFEERLGTCDEFSHLYVAMLRAVDIPAKFSASYVYSGTDWGAHAFVEAAIDGKWVPFDPTFNEGIVLDATHIKFGEGRDQADIKEDISISSYDADISKVKLTREFNVTFKETRNFPEFFELELIIPENVVGEHSIETIKAKLKNKDQRIAVPLSLLLPKGVEVPGENKFSEDKLVLLEPGEEKEVEWKIIMPELEGGYDYKFPVRLESLGQDAEGTIIASKDGDTSKKQELKVVGITAIENEETIELTIVLKNTGNVLSEGSALLNLDHSDTRVTRQYYVPMGGEGTVRYTLEKPSGNILSGYLVLEADNYRLTQPFSVSLDASSSPSPLASPSISIEPTPSPIPYIPDDTYYLVVIILIILGIFFLKNR